MDQLTLHAIYEIAKALKDSGVDLRTYPIYIGNDDELNGIHTAWFINMLNKNDEGSQDLIEMIDEDCCNIKFKDKAILIS